MPSRARGRRRCDRSSTAVVRSDGRRGETDGEGEAGGRHGKDCRYRPRVDRMAVHTQPIASPCSREFLPAYHTSGTRPLSDVRWIVLHDEEAPTARSAAEYFKSP